MWGRGGRGGGVSGGSPKGLVHNLLMHLFTPASSKMKVLETCFVILGSPKGTIQGMYSMDWAVFMCFSLDLDIGPWGGAPKGLVHKLLGPLFTMGRSKIEVFACYFFDAVVT